MSNQLTALATRIRQLSAYWTTEHSGMVPMPIDKVSNFPTFGWVRQRDVLAIADELDALAQSWGVRQESAPASMGVSDGDLRRVGGEAIAPDNLSAADRAGSAAPGADVDAIQAEAMGWPTGLGDQDSSDIRPAERIVQALMAAGFNVRAASPLQHHAECGFWRDRPCDCAIQQLQEAINDRDTR